MFLYFIKTAENVYNWSGQAESNRHYAHPKGADYHYPMARIFNYTKIARVGNFDL